MVWALLAVLGVPLWLSAVAIMLLVHRNRTLRKRHGDIPVRVLRAGKTRWTRGHALWVSDVFAWRGSPAAWNEALERIAAANMRTASPEEQHRLRGLGDRPVVAELKTDQGQLLRVATTAEHQGDLAGPFRGRVRAGDPVGRVAHAEHRVLPVPRPMDPPARPARTAIADPQNRLRDRGGRSQWLHRKCPCSLIWVEPRR
jgi:hypothetical protein